jgi:hypothetical protein
MKQDVTENFAIYASQTLRVIIGKLASYYGQRMLLECSRQEIRF